jgi:Fe-S-cluster containining protein
MPTQKEAIWLSCKPKTCCYNALVLVSGRDVWRISRTLGIPPWHFLVYFQSPDPRPDAFMLDKSGRAFRMVLSKQPSRRKKTSPPCIFLLRTRDGYHRCGLGDLRPAVCKSFPMQLEGGAVCVPGDTGCVCREWSLTDANIDEERALLETRANDFAEYCGLVEQWNGYVLSRPDDAPPLGFYEFCRFVVQAYEALAAHEAR